MCNILSRYLSIRFKVAHVSIQLILLIYFINSGSCLNLLSIPGPGMTEIDRRKSLCV